MLLELEITSFMQIESKTVKFTDGLNVFKGANEAGKSTHLLAIGYALCGTRFLPLSLDETVTWGKSVSSLSVKLTFEVEGITYTLTRSKSGAEITSQGLRVSGQVEVSGFVEKVYGINLATLQAVAFAKQNEVRGAVGGEATPLIEKLAKVGLLDELVNKISAFLPSGNTKALEQMVQTAEARLTVPVAPDLTGLVSEIAGSLELVQQLSGEVRLLSDSLPEVEAAGKKAWQEIAQVRANLEKLPKLEAEKLASKVIADTEVGELVSNIDELRMKASNQAGAEAVFNLYQNVFLKLKVPEVTFDSKEQFAIRAGKELRNLEQATDVLALLLNENIKLRNRLITEKTCGLCGKDLSEVPEVVKINVETNARLQELQSQLENQQKLVEYEKEVSNKLKETFTLGESQDNLIASLGSHVTVDNCWPKTATWVGEVPTPFDKSTNYAKLAKEEEARIKRHEFNVKRVLDASKKYLELEQEIKSLTLHTSPECDTAYTTWQDFNETLTSKSNQLHQAEKDLAKNEAELKLQDSKYEAAVKSYNNGLKDLEAQKELLNQYGENNALIKKLREARPLVAKRLWSSLLSSVSEVFSKIRGKQSVVSKSDKGFLVDGKPVEAYSESTKDALGLAIRVVLQASFLPAMTTLIIDEPASGMDDIRETAMIAAIASLGIKQVIMVTHSTVADAFAANLIQL